MNAYDAQVLDMLADRATGDLAKDDEPTLESMLGGTTDESMDLAAAAATVAMLEVEPLPEALRARLVADAERLNAPPVIRFDDTAREPVRLASRVAWLAAAAALALAISGWWLFLGSRSPISEGVVPPDREAFIASASGVRQASWGDWDDPEIAGVTGDAVWSDSAQSGFVRFENLPRLDETEQYQLWIVDERGLEDENGQSARISGAIFDAAGDGETIVRVNPSIPVRGAAAFAVTIEEAGGVWASDMSRRVVIASLGD